MRKILILLSTYNGEKYLEEQLTSFLIQRGVIKKLLVRDDGSSDNTLRILKKYKEDCPNVVEEIIKGENIGSTASFCELMHEAYSKYSGQFEYFAFADQDDYWLEDKLGKAVEKLEPLDNSKPNMYCSDKIIVDSKLEAIPGIRPAKVELTKERALARNVATGCTMVFNKRALELFITRKTEYIKIHDHAIFLICSFLGNVVYDEKPYILYRQHGHNQLGGLDTFKNRLADRIKKKGNLNGHLLEKTAKSFLEAYKDLLNEYDLKLINEFVTYRSSLVKRLCLFFSREISKERFEDNFFFKMKVLLGGV